MCSYSQKSMELIRDGITTFIFNMFCNFLSNFRGQLSPRLPVLHVQCGTHHVTQQHTDYLLPFKKADCLSVCFLGIIQG